MGRVHTITTTASSTSTPSLAPLRRAADLVVGTVCLLLAAPLLGALALAVRRSSHGAVFHREKAFDARGRAVELLSFRTTMDGAGTMHHRRLRAAVGASDAEAFTGAGRFIRATRTERLPRLLNVVRGERSLF